MLKQTHVFPWNIYFINFSPYGTIISILDASFFFFASVLLSPYHLNKWKFPK